ncbi:FAD-dependent oxidoreductase [Palleronia sp. KMU-117]|uniref:FAD-dependent oxidoreductase n=1 Tax=Palleronia sp. KMU-117 TaxID=3434108 RepID=UPI003D752310
MDFDYDLFVIGGGSGGVRAARIAAAEGKAKVALAEESRMGGTCVIRGCVPKKLMVFASEYPGLVDEAAAYGWEASAGAFDWPRFRGHLATELDRLEQVYRRNLERAGVTIFDQRATLADPHTVRLADGTARTAKHILIAAGGRPVRPSMPNAHLGMVSDDIFAMPSLPKSILIVGGGYIACEFACILNGLGVEVTQYYRGAQILRGFDDEARGLIAEMMRAQGIDLHLGTNLVEMAPAEGHPERQPTEFDAAMGMPASDSDAAGHAAPAAPRGAPSGPIWVKATNGSERVFDAVLFATGRAPNTPGLGLEDLGVRLGRNGQVVVDAYSQSSVPSIFAVGDVTDRINLTPVAIREGHAFADTIFGGRKTAVDHDLVPSAVFTQPELGTIGLTEEQAREAHRIEVYCTSFRPMRTAFIDRPERVLFKLIVEADTRRVLGCHIVAPGAGELIQMIGVAVKMGATKEDLDRTVAVHPTISEELVTMRTPVRTA